VGAGSELDAAGAAGVGAVAGAAAVSVAGAAVDVGTGVDALLELPRLKTLPILFTYLPMLRRRSLLSSGTPAAGVLMVMVRWWCGMLADGWPVCSLCFSRAEKSTGSCSLGANMWWENVG